jgi:hypothetical protein
MYVEFEVNGEILGYAGRIDYDALPAGGSTGWHAGEPTPVPTFPRRLEDLIKDWKTNSRVNRPGLLLLHTNPG